MVITAEEFLKMDYEEEIGIECVEGICDLR